mgnify:CR=1 FL=1
MTISKTDLKIDFIGSYVLHIGSVSFIEWKSKNIKLRLFELYVKINNYLIVNEITLSKITKGYQSLVAFPG